MKFSHLSKRQLLLLIFLFIVSVLLRFYKLGYIPAGLSLDEVNFGLSLSESFGDWVLNPVVVRAPFAIFGLLSLLFVFVLIYKLTKSFWISYLTLLIITLSPWHMQQSRVYSVGILAFTLVLLASIVVAGKLKSINSDFFKVTLFVTIIIFLASVVWVPKTIKGEVDRERILANGLGIGRYARAFSNKYIATYRFREKLAFENLDFGNYFFSGHPRERWGVEETQKLFISLIPLIFVGLFVIKKKIFWFLSSFGLLVIAFAVFVGLRGPDETLALIIPLATIAALGTLALVRGNLYSKFFLTAMFLVFAYELINFQMLYFSGMGTSMFSPRRPVFSELATLIEAKVQKGEDVYIAPRLDNVDVYLKFYFGGQLPRKIEIRDFNYKIEGQTGRFFVEILPDEPLPAEPLYTETSNWPDDIEVVGDLYDFNKRQSVVIFRQK